MRFFLSIDLSNCFQKAYNFNGTLISKFLTIGKTYSPSSNIKLATIHYDRKSPGLIERNWDNPIYNDERFFLFIGGYVLYRNAFRTIEKIVPTPLEVLNIIIEKAEKHYAVLKGNYYIVIYNKISSIISIYSSPMFLHPAFYSYRNNHLIFTNYLESFKEYFPVSLDEQGLLEFTLLDHCLHTRTIYSEISSMPGGYLIEFQKNRISERLIYDIAEWHNNFPVKRKEVLQNINQSLKTSIGDYVQSTDKFNISLTGGFDGRLNFSFIKKDDYSRLKARSYGIPGSSQISIPQEISKKLNFDYEPVFFDKEFEQVYSTEGLNSINLTCGITGFNRAVYPYAYSKFGDFSRSCILGQCDMIRPLFTNPAGVIFNEFSWPIFFSDSDTFRRNATNFSKQAFVNEVFFSKENFDNIYNAVYQRYRVNYTGMCCELQFYFFLLKESLMKFWHTEFHLVDIFVDDYVSFADLDYLELLFNSEYAGIYKGLLAKNQIGRKTPHDLYIDLMTLNNNKLNHFYNDRGFKPGWLKLGLPGSILAASAKKINSFKKRKTVNDTFNSDVWSSKFYKENINSILKTSSVFNNDNISSAINKKNWDTSFSYRLNRSVSLKLWLQKWIIE
jgi:hypothetical protein